MNNWVWKPRNNEKRSHTNGIINTAFLFDCLGYVFSDISSQAFFKVKSMMCKIKLQETQKVSLRNFRPEVFRVIGQLHSLTA